MQQMRSYARRSHARVRICWFSVFCIYTSVAAGVSEHVATQHASRGLKQNFGQFSALQDTQQTFGGWGGRWVSTPVSSGPSGGPGISQGTTAATRPNVRPTTVRSISNRPGWPSSSSSNNNNAAMGSAGSSSNQLVAGSSRMSNNGVGVSANQGGLTTISSPSTDFGGPGFITGGTNRQQDTSNLPRYDPSNGTFVGDNDVGFWPSLNPGSRADAAFISNSSSGTNTTLMDPDPIRTVRVPAAAFESGYCIPRQAFSVVNVTARACYAGSNLTTWDGEPVCARLDCSWRARGTNILNSATGCRTVVQRPQSICPVGCNLIEQLRFNTTVNRTQLVTRCSCKAGNQPCPGTWTACTCYEALLPRNVTGGFTVCSETQGECERKCNLAVSGTPRLAPLCPVALDPFLSTNATSAPVYPMFGWNIASQGSDVAPLTVAAGRRLMQLLGIRRGRAVLVAASDEQLAGKMQSRVVWNKGPGQTSCASHLQYRAWSQWVVCGVQKATQRLMGLMGRMTVTHSR